MHYVAHFPASRLGSEQNPMHYEIYALWCYALWANQLYLFFLSTRCFPYNLYKRTIIVCYHEQPLGSTGVHLSLFGPYVRIYGDIMVFFWMVARWTKVSERYWPSRFSATWPQKFPNVMWSLDFMLCRISNGPLHMSHFPVVYCSQASLAILVDSFHNFILFFYSFL